MPTGFLANNVCYETSPEAFDAYYSSFPVVVTQVSTNIITTFYKEVNNVWHYVQTRTSSTGIVTTLFDVIPVAPVLPACSAPSEFFAQGLQYGAAVVSLILIGWGFAIVAGVLK